MESTQKKLSRVRSPRVHITYDVEIGNAIVQRELPLIVGILADLSGSPAEPLPVLKERDFVEIDRDNFDEVMEGFVPRLTMKVADSLSEEEGATTNIELLFKSINDFSPLNLVRSIPKTNEIYQARIHLRDFLAKLDGNDALDELLTQLLSDEALQTEVKGVYADQEDLSAVEPSEFISKLLEEGGMALDESQRSYALTLVGQFALDILGQEASDSAGDAADRMNDRISQIDNLLTQQINLVMHDEGFQKLEATWRGLHYLVMNTETSTRLKLRVLNVSKRDLLKDLQKASEFDQSALFKKVYEDEFGTYGGDPFSVLVGDYEFGRHPEDIELLEKLSGVAAAAHAPFIAAAYAKLFDLQDYFRLSQPRDLSKIFESAELIKWRSFRDSEDSRYVTLTLPKVLLRLPYGPDTVVVDGF
ncbi:MAG: type VI secretion system contractile sheath large subunit, partial [Gammaproteobacteria bacterium]|nr:type VI secretion system contractile sheath large subunit [Gammaproteobacteria bacterium]